MPIERWDAVPGEEEEEGVDVWSLVMPLQSARQVPNPKVRDKRRLKTGLLSQRQKPSAPLVESQNHSVLRCRTEGAPPHKRKAPYSPPRL